MAAAKTAKEAVKTAKLAKAGKGTKDSVKKELKTNAVNKESSSLPGDAAAAKKAAKNARKKEKKAKRKREAAEQDASASNGLSAEKLEAQRAKRKAKRQRKQAVKEPPETSKGKISVATPTSETPPAKKRKAMDEPETSKGKASKAMETSETPLAKEGGAEAEKGSGPGRGRGQARAGRGPGQGRGRGRGRGRAEPPVVLLDKATAAKQVADHRAVECFLTGLPYMATEAHLAAHFKEVGSCAVRVLKDSAGKSKGTGFLTWPTAEQAIQACAFDGSKIQGRWIGVRLCEFREEGKRGTAAASTKEDDQHTERPDDCMSVILMIMEASSGADESAEPIVVEDVYAFLKGCKPTNVNLLDGWAKGKRRGMAFADFEDPAMVEKAVRLNGQLLKGGPCRVRYKMPKP